MRESVAETHDLHKHETRRDLAHLLAAAAALIIALTVLLYVLWKIVASTQATPFDADGVRCYGKADSITCIKTAEPAR